MYHFEVYFNIKTDLKKKTISYQKNSKLTFESTKVTYQSKEEVL